MKVRLRLDTNYSTKHTRSPTGLQTPISSTEPPADRFIPSNQAPSQRIPQTPDSFNKHSMLRPGTAETTDSRVNQTFLYDDDDSQDDSPHEMPDSVSASAEKLKLTDSTKGEVGVPFRELVDRLLLLPMAKQDVKFVPTFLCLYRAFATPYQLLAAIVDRFMKVDRGSQVQFSRVAEMLRYLQVLSQWTANYPGDLSNGKGRELVVDFINTIKSIKHFAAAAREISNNLEVVVADDDLDWAYEDTQKSTRSKSNSTSSRQTPNSSLVSIPSSIDDDTSRSTTLRSTNQNYEVEDAGDDAALVSPIAPSSIHRSTISGQSFSNLLNLEHARRTALGFRLQPHIPLGKAQWHLFMDTPLEDLAREITRMDWTMFSAVRPRDFVRHISLTKEQRRRSHQPDNLGAMVKHFNHLALFVTGMILVRDKPKHRARMLEKFMALAWKVRQMNNYNSLGAIVAGVNSHEIDRLTMTKDLIPPETHKEFLRLTVLMGTSKSYSAYRTAWENSFNERIPFVPLLQQDLTRASCGNPTLIGSNINWKKFEIMGDVIVGIQKSIETPYTFPPRCAKSDETVKLIVESKVVEETEVC